MSPPPVDQRIPLDAAQRRLAVSWAVFAALCFFVVIAQTQVGNVYGQRTDEVWQWFLPSVVPTLSLVLSVLANLELNAHAAGVARSRTVSVFFYRLAMGVCAMYLVLVLMHPILTALKDDPGTRLQLLRSSNVYLGPIQGLVAAVLGVFFVSAQEEAHSVPKPGEVPSPAPPATSVHPDA